MKTKIAEWMTFLLVVAGVAAVLWFSAWHQPEPTPVSIEAERAAADASLAEKLSGPRYFNAPTSSVREDGGLWIKVYEAREQIPRIVAERKLGPDDTRAVEQLVDQLSEHHPSRVLGGTRINLLRLNLSLDSIK